MGFGGKGRRGRNSAARPQAEDDSGFSGRPDPGPNFFVRPLAAQWRFVSRVLQRYAPEEPVYDANQLSLGDHIIVRGWGLSEHHAIVCSDRRREGHWIVHWDERAGALQCSPLTQLKGELFRVSYPHWGCHCYVPAGTLPYVLDERRLESENGEAVAKQATSLHRNGWTPSWRSPGLEFCLQVKTEKPPFQMHDKALLAAEALPSIGCSVNSCPSDMFSAGAAADAFAQSAVGNVGNVGNVFAMVPSHGYATGPVWDQPAAYPMGAAAYPMGAAAHPMGAAAHPMAGAFTSNLSPDAAVFVPGGGWDGMFQ